MISKGSIIILKDGLRLYVKSLETVRFKEREATVLTTVVVSKGKKFGKVKEYTLKQLEKKIDLVYQNNELEDQFLDSEVFDELN
jgi:hypothetical protein